MLYPCLDDEHQDSPFEEENTSSEEEPEAVDPLGDIVREKIRAKEAKKISKPKIEENLTKVEEKKKIASRNNFGANSFDDLNLSRPVLKAVYEAGFHQPTPIQIACIPMGLAGRDICACSATGTGKTAAFMLPIFERLLFRPKGRKSVTRVLVLVPTRELAIQVFQVSQKLAQFTQVNICLCAGGLDTKTQEAALRLCPDVVIATPGRLIDHLHNSPNFSLSEIEVLVLDEADRMLDEAFADQMKELIRLCSKKRQTMLFSATMTDKIEDLAKMTLNDPVRLFVNENTETALNLQQEYVRIRTEEIREAVVAALITRTFKDHTIIFVRTKWQCERLAIVLGLLGVRAAPLHGGLNQIKRVQALADFKAERVDVLCSTDLAARGLDVEGVMTVINMHMPSEIKHYVHRVGRTARAGKVGRAISLVGEDDRVLLKSLIQVNKHRPILQRTLAPDVISTLKEQIDGLAQQIANVANAEKAEREMREAEEAVQKAEQKITKANIMSLNGPPIPQPTAQRQWFRPSVDKKSKKKHKVDALKNNGENAENNNEEKRAQNEAAFQAREAKRNKKPKRMRVVEEPEMNGKGKNKSKKGAKKGSSFTSEIVNVGRKALKRHRHGPDDAEFQTVKRAQAKEGILRGPRMRN